jgi:hypothetical protein
LAFHHFAPLPLLSDPSGNRSVVVEETYPMREIRPEISSAKCSIDYFFMANLEASPACSVPAF